MVTEAQYRRAEERDRMLEALDAEVGRLFNENSELRAQRTRLRRMLEEVLIQGTMSEELATVVRQALRKTE